MHGYDKPWQLGCALKSLCYCSADNETIPNVRYYTFTYIPYTHKMSIYTNLQIKIILHLK